MSTQDAILTAKRFIAVVNQKYPVQRAYLFGSYAKGGADEASDIDVCIVSPVFGKDYLSEESELRRLSVKVDDRLSPVAFNPDDIKDYWNRLAYEITKYGTPI